jgi:hypothetical protein
MEESEIIVVNERISSERLINEMIFQNNTTIIENIEDEFEKALVKDKTFLIGIIAIVLVIISIFLLWISYKMTGGEKFVLAVIATLFLGAGTAIQLGTVMYSIFSKRLSGRINKITSLVTNTQKATTKIDYIITKILRGDEIKCTDEILYEMQVKIQGKDIGITKPELVNILKLLKKNRKITHPKAEISILKVDRTIYDLKEDFDNSLLKRIKRIGTCDDGSKSLIYLQQEFSDMKIKKMTRNAPVLSAVDFGAMQDIRKKVKDELNKLGIVFVDYTLETKLWKSNLSSYDRNLLSRRIRVTAKNLSIRNDNLSQEVGKFIAYQSVLDTKIAVLCLAIAGVIGGLWDLIY